jgi:predicted GNAT superfamily acetyltransferase
MDLRQHALEHSIAAQSRAGVRIQNLSDLAELDDARLVFDTVWPSLAGSTQVQSNLMKALVHAGGYCAAAYVDDQPVGAALGFIGQHRDDLGIGHVHLHSHMAAVLEPYRDRHVGAALKVHQRWWALDQDIDVIMWTFDPLVRRNARLNLIKLGTEVRGYEVNFYGEMDDAINAGDPSDRMFAWWEVGSTRAIEAAEGKLAPMDIEQLTGEGRDVIEIAVPDDIVNLRTHDPHAAQEWRVKVRTAFLESAKNGYVITGVSRDGNYVLERS